MGSEPDWQLANLFNLDPPAIRTLKIKLASHLGLRYAVCNQAKAFALAVGSTPPYEADLVKKNFTEYYEKLAIKEPERSSGVSSFTINGCQVRWETAAARNVGYILTSCTKYVEAWDVMIERRAGGLVAERFHPHDEQELTLTNMSSLLCLIAHIVFQFKTKGLVDPPLARAFSGIRVALYRGATADEVRALNFHENVEQRQRKAHCELDNIESVRQWRASMRAFAHPRRPGVRPGRGQVRLVRVRPPPPLRRADLDGGAPSRESAHHREQVGRPARTHHQAGEGPEGRRARPSADEQLPSHHVAAAVSERI